MDEQAAEIPVADIVDRIRESLKVRPTTLLRLADLAEAANEIERLRALIQDMGNQIHEGCERETALRSALLAVTEFAAEYAGGQNSDLGDVEEWEPMKRARAALTAKS